MSRPWTIVLAAGAGRRLTSLTGGVPKQFWPGPGGTLLSQTLRRFAPVSDRRRRVVIVDASHRAYLRASDRLCGPVVYQPCDRGTAAGVLLSLSPVLAADPDATVVMTPSDHGVENTTAFLEGIDEAVRTVQATDDIVVFGVEPTSVSDDYGWILPGERRHVSFRHVVGFIEKPEKAVATKLFGIGAAWNTMVMVARARTLRDLCFRFVPSLEAALAGVLDRPPGEAAAVLDRAYAELPHSDFSREVLTRARTLSTYTWPAEMGWSDLGTPERMLEWHRPGHVAAVRATSQSSPRTAPTAA